MPASETYNLAINVKDFDTSVLPPDSRDTSTDSFRNAARAFLKQCVKRLGGDVIVKIDGDEIAVAWTPAHRKLDPVERVAGMLRNGNYIESVILLQLLLSGRPDDIGVLYNLGMALSDMGKLEQAEQHLRHALKLVPGYVNARIALGVALTRAGRIDEAVEELERAARLEPGNSYAQRNLGAALLKLGREEEAIAPLRAAAELNPDHQRAWYGLAQALELTGQVKDADETYLTTIRLGEHTEVAELARKARSRIAQHSFRPDVSGELRMDAVMYCLGAIERFEGMSMQEVQSITFEIAMLGRRGLDVNDPTPKYQLRSLNGDFSGLHLVSIEYVGFKLLDPSVDIGFDLSREYGQAQALHWQKS
jgi:Flp pilus assembly protein TadD